MPSLDDLFAQEADKPVSEPAVAEPLAESATVILPNLDDLFADLPEPQPATATTSTPAPTTAPSLDLPDLPDLDELF